MKVQWKLFVVKSKRVDEYSNDITFFIRSSSKCPRQIFIKSIYLFNKNQLIKVNKIKAMCVCWEHPININLFKFIFYQFKMAEK